MHLWDTATPIEETLRTFDDLVRCGKILYVGASNVVGWQLQKIMSTSEKLGLNPFVSLQQQYSLVCRETEFEPLQVCKNEGLGVLPWSPLKGGLLSGKYSRESVPTTGRLGWVAEDEKSRGKQSSPAWTPVEKNAQIWDVVDCLKDISKTRNKSVAQVALRWLLQKDVVSSIIVGATKLSQLDDNMGAANGWSLTTEEMSRLDTVSQPTIPYPYEMMWRRNENRQNSFMPSFHVANTS